jgi:hypothetical protein
MSVSNLAKLLPKAEEITSVSAVEAKTPEGLVVEVQYRDADGKLYRLPLTFQATLKLGDFFDRMKASFQQS